MRVWRNWQRTGFGQCHYSGFITVDYMEITYRAANFDDLNDIFHLVENAVQLMNRNKIYQWDSVYLAKEDFNNDI